MNTYIKFPLFLFLFIMGFFFSISSAAAVDPKPKIRDEAYSAKFVSQSISDPILLEAGEKKIVTIRFKNTGTATWNSSGSRYVSAYTMEPRDRASVFVSPSWKSVRQTNPISKTTKPGEIAELAIELTAPKKEGEYVEHFYLAAENYSWMKGSYFYLKITVVPAKTPASTVNNAPGVSNNTSSSTASTTIEYVAKRFMQNIDAVSVKGGERVRFIVGFQNLGVQTWKKYSLRSGNPTALASVSESLTFADEGWQNNLTVATRDREIKQFDTIREDIYFRAPAKKGTYTATFYLQADGSVMNNTVANVQVTVTEDAPEHYVESAVSSGGNTIPHVEEIMPRLDHEPRIRVGLWKPESFVQFRSNDDDYDVYDGEDKVGMLPRGQLGSFSYTNGTYLFSGADIFLETKKYIRLAPVTNPHAVFELLNFKRSLSWKGNKDFNKYRGALEYRMTQDNSALYVINDLLFEDYVRGIAENSNAAPMEYLKAQSVAQRTYAYYVAMDSSKHDKRNFDVVATTGDQLYAGYESEELMPRFLEAVEATRGYMVTYNNTIVITPYFAHTDGRTRSWTEVWGGATKPWLVAVPAEYDKSRGTRLFGHGVGMSQIDASMRADKEGVDWQTLLKYYYSGTAIEKIYR